MNNTFYDPHTYFLAHHGIVGQKWGKRNGPPYPLNASTHNRVVKRGKKVGNSSILSLLDPAYNLKEQDRQNAIGNRKGVIDKRTSLTKKTRRYSEEEDCKLVNPGYDRMTGDTRNNCGSCSIAYDARRRGYDVISILSSKPLPLTILDDVYPDHKEFWYAKNSKFGLLDTKCAPKKNFINDITSNTDSNGNSRGIISLFYGSGAGHALNYSVNNGKIRFIDSQSGDIYDKDDVDWIVTDPDMKQIMYFRTDNILDNNINYNELKKYVK